MKDSIVSKKAFKNTIKILCAVMAAVILLVFGYLMYVVFGYYRVEDYQKLDIKNNVSELVPVNQSLTGVTHNIGFGAYSADYSFFMDGGEHSRAYSEKAVKDNTNGSLSSIKSQNPDFILLQEVDVKSDRSYKVNQTEIFKKSLSGYGSVFAQNFDSPYLFYPFLKPIGKSKSGIMTFSKYNISSSLRRSLPVENSVYKFVDLDRAYSVSRIKTALGNELVLYNVHLSAYTSDGSIADSQLKMLGEDMAAEYKKGNYCIAAGDFNKDMLGDSSKYFKRSEGEFTWAKPLNTKLLPNDIKSYSGKNVPTCRNADSPYKGDGTDFVLSVDGVLASANVSVTLCETVDTAFAFSDHNPVKFEFTLLG